MVDKQVLECIATNVESQLSQLASSNMLFSKEVLVLHFPLTEAFIQVLLSEGVVPLSIVAQKVIYTLDSARIIGKKPHSINPIPWHQDTPHDMISYWIPLHDVNKDDGALRLKPGNPSTTPVFPVKVASGNLGVTLDFEKIGINLSDFEETAANVEMTAGQILVFHAKTPHCSTPNQGDKWRLALVFRFVADHAEFPTELANSLFSNVTGVEFLSGTVPQLSSPVFNTGNRGGHRGHRGGHRGHHRGHHGHHRGHHGHHRGHHGHGGRCHRGHHGNDAGSQQQIAELRQEYDNLIARGIATLNAQEIARFDVVRNNLAALGVENLE